MFRIDHYLGKETVQNILAFRFANRLWEPVWSSQHIDHVQITVAESIGIEGRASYYEEAGALRDVVQNHMLQVLALVAMEAPVTFEAEAVRDEKVKVLKALHPFNGQHIEEDAVRGQYTLGHHRRQAGAGLPRRSRRWIRARSTETYAALKVGIDNWRWAGHALLPAPRQAAAEAGLRDRRAVQGRAAPALRRRRQPALEPDLLLLRLQPDEGIVLRFGAKQPGPEMQLRSVDMEFNYERSFSMASPDAYERLILDCALGERTLFTRADEVESPGPSSIRWRMAGGIRTHASTPTPPASWGPDAARALLARDGRKWHDS